MTPASDPGRRALGPAVATMLAVAASLIASGGCSGQGVGEPPPRDQFFFPSGLLLDPRAEPGEPARYLFVANGNNDLAYDSGTLVAVDLDAFFAAWAIPGTYTVDPFCNERCVLDVGSPVDDELPCRRLALLPQIVECDEGPFVRTSQRTGDFATLLTHSCEDDVQDGPTRGNCQKSRIWLPVRGDPSLLYLDLPEGSSADEVPEFQCGQEGDGTCDASHRLRNLRNDTALDELPREPFNMVISPSKRLAYVTHTDGSGLSLVDLDGIDDGTGAGDGRPALVDLATVFLTSSGTTGGFGLAERPCSPDRPSPSITLGCTRPLVYAGFRYAPLLTSFTVQAVEGVDPSQCAGAGEFDQAGKISCDERVRSQRLISPGGLDPSSTRGGVLGDLAFPDPSGDELLVLQTGPGALLKINTRVGTDGEPFDTPSAPPLELCDEPSRMDLYEDAGQRYALVSCFRAANLYVVDLQGFRVIESIVAGTGPYELTIDQPRLLAYLSNNLEGSISVVDLSSRRPTRFREIARIGLQEPFSR